MLNVVVACFAGPDGSPSESAKEDVEDCMMSMATGLVGLTARTYCHRGRPLDVAARGCIGNVGEYQKAVEACCEVEGHADFLPEKLG